MGDRGDFLRRVSLGYRLNDLGLGSTAVIQSFDLDRELLAMLERKRRIAGKVHSDHSRGQGRPFSQWFDRPGQMGGLLGALQARGWIRRHEPPTTSRFWQLTEGEGSAMFGVFSPFEKQLLHDWIAGDWLATPAAAPRPWRSPLPQAQVLASANGEFNAEGRALEAELARLGAGAKLARLIDLMAPAAHHRPAGLLATRLFIAQTR
ncbi:hypothetical protein FQZ97_747710 [compost metagenome]